MERLKKIINYLSLEEFLNAITHGIGAVLAVVGFVALIIEAYLNGGKWHLVSFLIYGISLILLYVASTLYHSFKNERIKGYLKIFPLRGKKLIRTPNTRRHISVCIPRA